MHTRFLRMATLQLGILCTTGMIRPVRAQLTGPLVVYNAGSLAAPFRDLLNAFVARHPGVVPAQETSGSIEAARKLTELGKIPDVIGVADYGVIPKLLIPKFAGWYVTFARNAMVVVYSDQSIGASEITPQNWWQVLLRPEVRTGRADPALDPNGYRTLMVLQLAEKLYQQPGLAARLQAAMPPRYMRPKEADLTALIQAGELDYSFSYYSLAKSAHLRFVDLPPEVDLSDPARADWYAQADIWIPRGGGAGADSVEFRGEPIVYALSIPLAAPHPEVAAAFALFALSPDGRAIIERSGLVPLARPLASGPSAPPAGIAALLGP
jgi:molybdate/tungstate transport system substrate-binding protein